MGRVVDFSNGYEDHALAFLDVRDRSPTGHDVVERWAQSLKPHAEVIEIGCGGGHPVTRALVKAGLSLWAIDASPTLLAKFKVRFPAIPVKCEQAECSDYFRRHYDAAIAVGLLFLLSESSQIAVIKRVSEILRPGGRFLFTAPIEVGTWKDAITNLESRSLGSARYEEILVNSGFRMIATCDDEGANNYYEAEKLVECTSNGAD
jgi:SAM-dependent methyltransferase